jgi:pimeloyl-ACP methyl ester carboxylesterase
MGGLGLTIPVLLIAAMLAAGVLYQWRGVRLDARRFPPPGRLIDNGEARLHAFVTGTGPAVVFEAGIAATSLSWRLVQPEIAIFAQTVSYDRAGLGWSAASSKPREVWQMVEELRTLLDRVKVPAPRVLVAHSYGCLIALGYAARYPGEVAGLILLDPVGIVEWADPSTFHRQTLRKGILLARFGEILSRLGVVRFTVNRLVGGSRRMPKLVARATSGRAGEAFTQRMVGQIRKLPPEVWPMIQSHWCDPKCFRAMARYLQALPQNAAAVLEEFVTTSLPLTILSAADASPSQRADHERIARLSSQGSVEIIQGAGHWIQLDRPDLVIQAIRGVLSRAKANALP